MENQPIMSALISHLSPSGCPRELPSPDRLYRRTATQSKTPTKGTLGRGVVAFKPLALAAWAEA